MGDKLVLVVEDEADLREFVEAVLSAEGYRVMSACDGIEALQRLENKRPNVILLDMRLPRMDGWEFARELQSRRNGNVPIIVMTALQARQIARQIKAKGFLQKPFDIDDLLKAVESADG